MAIVGKGVCFDTGGLDIKPADGMRNMKKDMGGAAHAIALAELVMARKLPLRITLLVPAVENAIGPEAFRPGEVIATRTGMHVEIDNTDAEGRVVLGDALTYAGEQSSRSCCSTSPRSPAPRASRSAPTCRRCTPTTMPSPTAGSTPACRCAIRCGACRCGVRTCATSPATSPTSPTPARRSMAGSITAALYLERFVPAQQPWAHLDVYAWNDSDRPGQARPAAKRRACARRTRC